MSTEEYNYYNLKLYIKKLEKVLTILSVIFGALLVASVLFLVLGLFVCFAVSIMFCGAMAISLFYVLRKQTYAEELLTEYRNKII